MLESRTLSISIARDWRAVYESVWRPADFGRWASGLSKSTLQDAGDGWWRAEGPEGSVRIRFSDHNGFGVMDHHVDLGTSIVHVPLRIVANEEGAEVLFTLFRQPGTSAEKFAADTAWVGRDLLALKTLCSA